MITQYVWNYTSFSLGEWRKRLHPHFRPLLLRVPVSAVTVFGFFQHSAFPRPGGERREDVVAPPTADGGCEGLSRALSTSFCARGWSRSWKRDLLRSPGWILWTQSGSAPSPAAASDTWAQTRHSHWPQAPPSTATPLPLQEQGTRRERSALVRGAAGQQSLPNALWCAYFAWSTEAGWHRRWIWRSPGSTTGRRMERAALWRGPSGPGPSRDSLVWLCWMWILNGGEGTLLKLHSDHKSNICRSQLQQVKSRWRECFLTLIRFNPRSVYM